MRVKESVVNPSPSEKETSPAYMGWRHSEYTPVVLRTVPSAGTGHGEKFRPSCRAPEGGGRGARQFFFHETG